MVTAWWELPETARYLREHLIEHLLAAGRAGQAEEIAADLRWAGARLQASGPAGPYADLALIGTPRAERLAPGARAGRAPAGADRPAALADRHPVQQGQPRPGLGRPGPGPHRQPQAAER